MIKSYEYSNRALDETHETMKLNEFFNQEPIHWKPVAKSEKQQELEQIRDKYRVNQLIKKEILNDRVI